MGALSVAGKTAMRWTVWGRLLLAAEVALTLKRHLDNLEPEERTELRQIVTKSKGRPSNLSNRERKRLSLLVGKIEPGELAKATARNVVIGRKGKK